MTRALLIICALLLPLSGCERSKAAAKGGEGKPKGPMAVPVETVRVQTRDVQRAVKAVGSVEAFELVQVTARVAGAIEKVAFREGDEVSAGKPLVDIEPARFQIALSQAKAQLERAQSAQVVAKASTERREAVNEKNPGLIRGEELETFRASAAAANADLSAARAAVEQAQLNLKDAYVRAPIAGVIQTRTVQTGQYVQPGSVLATVVRKDPMLLRFQVTELDAASLAKGQPANFAVRGTKDRYEATVTLVAGTADPKSRLVQITAEVVDAGSLRPGTFAEVSVPVGGSSTAPVIPQTAIRPSERGFLAYIVEGDKATERVVELGLATEDGQVEVKTGLAAGDQLVVRGAEALREGATVKVMSAGTGHDASAGGAAP